jgi:hypothetical protein
MQYTIQYGTLLPSAMTVLKLDVQPSRPSYFSLRQRPLRLEDATLYRIACAFRIFRGI